MDTINIDVLYTITVNEVEYFFDDSQDPWEVAFTKALRFAREKKSEGCNVTLFSEPDCYFYDIDTGEAIKNKESPVVWAKADFTAIDIDELPF
jgi:hypothetical protein